MRKESAQPATTGVVKSWLQRHGLSYELMIKVTLGLMFVLIIGANLNSMRFFNTVESVNEQRLARDVAERLALISQTLSDHPRLGINTNETRRLAEAAGFEKLYVVETEALRHTEVGYSEYTSIANLHLLQELYGLPKKLAGGATTSLPTSLTYPYAGIGGESMRAGFYHFMSSEGVPLTLVGTLVVPGDREVNKLAKLNTVFQILSVLAVLTIVLVLLRLTLTPYRKIKSQAIAAEIASTEQAESVDFAVETFQKVIDELRQKEEKLQRLYAQQKSRAASLERYNEFVLESMYSAVVSCDTDGNVTHYNRAAEELFGGKRSEKLHKPIGEAISNCPGLAELVKEVLASGLEATLPEREQQVGGARKIWLNISCTLLRDLQGHIQGAMLLATDLSEIKKLEAEISLKDQMATIGEMAAGLAHQLRNSLGAMIGFVQLLKKITADSPQASGIVENILVETKDTSAMVDRFLTLSRDTKFSPAEVSLAHVEASLRAKLEPELEARDIKLKIEIDRTLDEIVVDEMLFVNTLHNLIQNAIQASQEGSSVHLIIRSRSAEEIEVQVRDQGSGISAENLPNIFTPFFTHGKVDGTGLGLALVRKWVHQHGGTIQCESKENEGTTFTLTFPQNLPVSLY